MKRLFTIALALLTTVAAAFDTTDAQRLDVGFFSGIVTGSVVKDEPSTDDNGNPTTVSRPFLFSGVLFGANVYFDFMRWFSISLGPSFVLDMVNTQITRKGLDATAYFHLWGGARRTLDELDYMVVMVRDPISASALFRIGFQSYNPSSKVDPDRKVDGTVFASEVGGEFRYDLGDRSSLSLALLYSLYTFPASIERVRARLLTIQGTWRLFL